MKIAFFSTQSYDKIYFNEVNVHYGYELVYFDPPLNERTAVLAEGCDAVCIFVNDKADAATMEKLIKMGISNMVLRCAGFNQVDLDAAKTLGMKILRVPAYSPEAVAEHAVALILTLNRKTHKAYNRVREGNFSLDRLTGFNLHGKTVGIIGLGKIGRAFSRIMHGFGCKVIAYDPFEVNVADYIQLVTLDELFDRSDIISIHCPLTPENKHLINKDTLEKMKPGVMLINTSRGALVNSADAIIALKHGKLGYMGIDVYEQEENLFFRDLSESLIPDDEILRLMSFPNVLITAHQAFLTMEALTEIAETTLENLKNLEEGIASVNSVL
ncbi:2-hydroxyacid dehydrogenase [Pedobacter immunditicola]|uniref:2-hydroxyacid dehydrogenase n=1 Tax=Pedobacter immunditicola TaxID=3133440 RepID=UPI0030A0F7D2